MMFYGIFISSSLLLYFCVQSTAIPKPDDPIISEHLLHSNHLQNPHDTKYDHDQFLGEDQAKTFDQLLPEESRRRLG